MIGLNIILLYISITSITVVSEYNIVDYKFYNLKGIGYSYEDIKSVETGFSVEHNRKNRGEGEFYYQITMKNGESINFTEAISNRYEVTFTEYAEFDNRVMRNNVVKIGSTENADKANLAQEYIDILCGVINNKNN